MFHEVVGLVPKLELSRTLKNTTISKKLSLIIIEIIIIINMLSPKTFLFRRGLSLVLLWDVKKRKRLFHSQNLGKCIFIFEMKECVEVLWVLDRAPFDRILAGLSPLDSLRIVRQQSDPGDEFDADDAALSALALESLYGAGKTFFRKFASFWAELVYFYFIFEISLKIRQQCEIYQQLS